jgi:linoleoyl-CoA desaturase
METEKLDIVRFASRGKHSFIEILTIKVKAYFTTHRISPYANAGMWLKTIIMLLLYFVPYLLIVTGMGATNRWVFMGLWFVMSWGMSGIGTAVMHDANHGAYSPKRKVNQFISHILEVIGGYTVTWKIQHNMLHHIYTNIAGLDEDIDSMILLRLSPRQKRYRFHRYQYLYAWFLYMMLTLFWMTIKDYLQVIRYKQHDLLIKQKVSLKQALLQITVFKLGYYAYILALPILFSGQPWYWVLAGFLLMHFWAGLFLSCVFQPSHVMEESAFSLPVNIDGIRYMEDSWAVHELANTTDFAPGNRFLSWFIGGLNYQIEHHLFTGVCHVHYKRIAPIVRATASEFGLPYHVQPTFLRALLAHARMLKILGKA